MSSLKRKLEGEVEIRATAADVHHEIVGSKPYHVSQVASHFIQAVDLHEGDYGNVGSITVCNYTTLDGKPAVAKTVLDENDKEKKLVKYRVMEGNLLEDYKTFVGICQVIPKDEDNCIVRWTMEYEKLHSGIPEPTSLLDTWLDAAKHIDNHHHGIKK